MQNDKRIDSEPLFLGLNLFGRSKQELLNLAKKGLKKGNELVTIATPNPEQLVQAHQNEDFREQLHQFDLLLPDGQGVVIASRLLRGRAGVPIVMEKIPGREVVESLLELASKQQLKVVVVGGRGYAHVTTDQSRWQVIEVAAVEDYAQAARASIKQGKLPIFWLPGYEQISQPTAPEAVALERWLTELKPDLVFVAFGAPFQEAWVISNRHLLEKIGAKVAMVVGGSFDYLLGKVARAPRFVSAMGFEWLWRLAVEPWRWRRQLRLLSFIGLVIKELTRG